MQWMVFWTWTAIPFLGSPCITACLCSLSLTFSVLLASPTYTSGQSLQGISYTTPVCFCSGVLFFTCISSLSKFSLVWRQASPPEGHRPLLSSRLAPWCMGCTVSWVLCPVVLVPRFPGVAVGGSLGSSSPGCLGTHSPGTPNLGGPFPVASLWDGRCYVLYPSCISRLPLWSPGGDVRGKGCKGGHLHTHSSSQHRPTYLLTISSPDINKVAMSLYDIDITSKHVHSISCHMYTVCLVRQS